MPGQAGQDGKAGHDGKGRFGTCRGAFWSDNVAVEDQKVRQCYNLGHFRARGATGVAAKFLTNNRFRLFLGAFCAEDFQQNVVGE